MYRKMVPAFILSLLAENCNKRAKLNNLPEKIFSAAETALKRRGRPVPGSYRKEGGRFVLIYFAEK
ncbi:hypothetical protein U6B65_09565 [Oscillospiraceae bacterium MB08-C2-2]|nr:hypothetical protein U6B65_09565 [Oscillospiraceae bacterium MB08-C2-2]